MATNGRALRRDDELARPENGSSPAAKAGTRRLSVPPRVVIAHVRPRVDCGRKPVKAAIGDLLKVGADSLSTGPGCHRLKLEGESTSGRSRRRSSAWPGAPRISCSSTSKSSLTSGSRRTGRAPSREADNWRRRARRSLAETCTDPNVHAMLWRLDRLQHGDPLLQEPASQVRTRSQ
jgi:hypothetical protein